MISARRFVDPFSEEAAVVVSELMLVDWSNAKEISRDLSKRWCDEAYHVYGTIVLCAVQEQPPCTSSGCPSVPR